MDCPPDKLERLFGVTALLVCQGHPNRGHGQVDVGTGGGELRQNQLKVKDGIIHLVTRHLEHPQEVVVVLLVKIIL